MFEVFSKKKTFDNCFFKNKKLIMTKQLIFFIKMFRKSNIANIHRRVWCQRRSFWPEEVGDEGG